MRLCVRTLFVNSEEEVSRNEGEVEINYLERDIRSILCGNDIFNH